MDEIMQGKLRALGIDTQDALTRFMGNDTLLMRFLLNFPQDPNFQNLKRAMEDQNVEAAYQAVHALKGVAGNLSMTELFRQSCAITEDLRNKDFSSAMDKMDVLEAQYLRIVSALKNLNN